MLDKKTFAIGILSLSAVILLVANILAPRTARATYETIENQDFAMVTATALGGGDAIYVTEKRSGLLAVFVFDPNRKSLDVMDVEPVQAAFSKMKKP